MLLFSHFAVYLFLEEEESKEDEDDRGDDRSPDG